MRTERRIYSKLLFGFLVFCFLLFYPKREYWFDLFAQQNPIQIDANGLTQTLTAGGVVVRGQIVKINSAGQVVPVLTTDTSGAIGVAATSQTSAGNGVQVSIAGTPLVQIDASGCSAGNIVSFSSTTGAAGHCAATASGQQVGIAISTSAPGSNFWNVQLSPMASTGSSLSIVSSLPASCTGSTAPVVLVISGVNYGTFVCDPNGGNVWIPENPNQTISPYAYGAVGHVRYTYNASWANASSTVSCSNGECSFQCPGGIYPCTSSTTGCPSLTCDAGKIVKGAGLFPQVNFNNLSASGTGVTLPQGTISTVTNTTTITVSTTSTSACPTGSITTCTLSWGVQDDTTAINNAAAAAWGNHNRCIALQLPADAFYFSGPVLNGPQGTLKAGDVCSTLAAANGGSDLTNTGPSVYGAGTGTTVLIPLSSWNFAGCTFGSGSSCNGTMPNLQAHDFAINGLGDTVAATHNVALWESIGSNAGGACDGGTTLQNLNFTNWALNSSSSIGFKAGVQSCADAVQQNVYVVQFGATTCNLTPSNNYNVYSLYCAGAGAGLGNVLNITIGAGSQLNTYGSQFVCTLNAGNQVVAGAVGQTGKWNSNGDWIGQGFTQCPSQAIVVFPGGQAFDLTDDILTLGTSAGANSFLLRSQGNAAVVHLKNNIINGNGVGSSTALSSAATDKWFFDGGNVITNAGNANSLSGALFGQTNDVAGTVCATGNFALTSGWGTSTVASVAANGNIQGCHVTITGAAGAAGPVLTWTYPAAPVVAPGSCHIVGVSGTLTGVAVGTPGATTVAFTFAGTPSAQTYVFDVGCP